MTSLPKRILVVEDEEIIRVGTAKILEKEGYHCLSVDGITAARKALEDPVDLIISDMRMEGNMDLEFFKELQDHYVHIPVIVMTGVPSVSSQLRKIPSTIVCSLTKPVKGKVLLKAVNDAFRS